MANDKASSGGGKPAKANSPTSKEMKAVGRNMARVNNQKKGKK